MVTVPVEETLEYISGPGREDWVDGLRDVDSYSRGGDFFYGAEGLFGKDYHAMHFTVAWFEEDNGVGVSALDESAVASYTLIISDENGSVRLLHSPSIDVNPEKKETSIVIADDYQDVTEENLKASLVSFYGTEVGNFLSDPFWVVWGELVSFKEDTK